MSWIPDTKLTGLYLCMYQLPWLSTKAEEEEVFMLLLHHFHVTPLEDCY